MARIRPKHAAAFIRAVEMLPMLHLHNKNKEKPRPPRRP